MQVLAISNCGCGREKCAHSKSVIVCLYAQDELEKEMVQQITEDFEIDAIELPDQLVTSFWKSIEENKKIVESAKSLLPHLYR